MKRQLLILIAVTIMLWWGVYFLGNQIPPASLLNIFFFVAYLFLTFGITFSLIILLVKKRKAVTPQRIQDTFTYSIKWGFFVSLGLMGTLALKAFDLINPLIFGLFLVLYTAVFLQLRDKK